MPLKNLGIYEAVDRIEATTIEKLHLSFVYTELLLGHIICHLLFKVISLFDYILQVSPMLDLCSQELKSPEYEQATLLAQGHAVFLILQHIERFLLRNIEMGQIDESITNY